MKNWIKVEDKLPAPFQVVVTYGKTRGGKQIMLAHYNHHWMQWLSNVRVQKKITHWMPVPEPPKE